MMRGHRCHCTWILRGSEREVLGAQTPWEMVTAESARPRDLAAVFPSAPCALFALNVRLFSKSFFYFEITTESQEVAKKCAGSPVGPPGPRRPAWRRPAAGGWDSGLDLLTVPRPRAQTGVRRGAFLRDPALSSRAGRRLRSRPPSHGRASPSSLHRGSPSPRFRTAAHRGRGFDAWMGVRRTGVRTTRPRQPGIRRGHNAQSPFRRPGSTGMSLVRECHFMQPWHSSSSPSRAVNVRDSSQAPRAARPLLTPNPPQCADPQQNST